MNMEITIHQKKKKKGGILLCVDNILFITEIEQNMQETLIDFHLTS